MRIFKRILLSIFLILLVSIMFRGWLYRHLVTYKSIGHRTNYDATDEKLIAYIKTTAKNKDSSDIHTIIETVLSATSRQLHFTTGKNNNDPNKLIYSSSAHCVGYAAFFATTCNFLLNKYGFAETWTATPQVGQLYFSGINIHPYFHSPFFKDHDFVLTENKQTGETIATDPTVHDYLWIDYVTSDK